MGNHGALVGWTHRDLGERLMVNIETVQSVSAASDHHPDVLRIVMTRNQAALLGGYLLTHSGLSQPQRPSMLKRLFG